MEQEGEPREQREDTENSKTFEQKADQESEEETQLGTEPITKS